MKVGNCPNINTFRKELVPMGYSSINSITTTHNNTHRRFKNEKNNKIIFINPLADTHNGISADVRLFGEYESN